MHLRPLLTLLTLLASATTPALAQFTLSQTGGTFRADATNAAAAANGATAFGLDELSGFPHFIAAVNDGIYGNESSWIGNSSDSWVGVRFAAATDIDSFAFGRDNNGVYADRAGFIYTIQYSTDSLVGFDPFTATWNTIGTLDYISAAPSSPSLRHLYSLDTPLSDVTAFRIIASSTGAAIDELEVYAMSAVPEPSTYAALAGLAMLGFAVWRKRRQAIAAA